MNLNLEFPFFLVCPLGFEKLAQCELLFWLSKKNQVDQISDPESDFLGIEIVKGGVNFKTSLYNACFLHEVLKSPVRILLRLDEFKCRDFPTFFQRIQNMKTFGLLKARSYEFSSSCQKSRINHESRLNEVALEAFDKKLNFKSLSESAVPTQTIYLRIVNDICQVSLDLTGAPLYKRGYKINTSEASLRENLAFLLIQFFTQELREDEKGHFKKRLIDPFCGSGTFLFEAYLQKKRLGMCRSYVFPFKIDNYENLFKKFYKSKMDNPVEDFFNEYLGQDILLKNIESVQKTKKELEKQGFHLGNFNFTCEDALSNKFDLNPSFENWVICNPPYGKRVSLQGLKNQDFSFLVSHLVKKFNAKRLGILLPQDIAKKVKLPVGFQKKYFQFENGGLKVTFLFFYK